MLQKIVLLALSVLMGGCANTNVNSSRNIHSLPKKCGEYDVHYGVPEGYKKEDGTIVNIKLNGKNMSYLDAKYVGKEVAVFTWVQVVGSLPYPDGSGGEAIYYYNPVKVLPLRGEYDLLNRDAIETVCRELAHKKI